MPNFLFEHFIELNKAAALQVVALGFVENASVLRRRGPATRRASCRGRSGGEVREQRTLDLARAFAEALCEQVLSEGIDAMICGGIEGECYEFLRRKKVQVIDSVIGLWHKALPPYREGNLESAPVLVEGNADSCRGH
jgi:predicted Fe-Mo cluster-binding NifX family protein